MNQTGYAPFRYGAEHGSDRPCPHCNAPKSNQHSLRTSALCDGKRRGVLDVDGQRLLQKLVGKGPRNGTS